MKKLKRRYRLYIIVGSIVIVVALFIILTLLALFYNQGVRLLGLDVFNIIVQFFVIVVVGALVSFLFKLLQDIRSEIKKVKEDEREFFQFIITAYNKIKFARRMLRGEGLIIDEKELVKKDIYIKYMGELNKGQLQFEYAIRILPKNEYLFDDKLTKINNYLDRIEKNLNNINSEFEKFLPKMNRSHDTFELNCDVKNLKEFLGKAKSSDFFNCFRGLKDELDLQLNIEDE